MKSKKTPTPAPQQPPPMAYAPPSHLSPAAKRLWREIVPSAIQALPVRTMLLAALEAHDRADSARRAIRRDGMVSVSGTGIPHVHPLLKVERDSRQQFAAIWKSLGLDHETPEGESANPALEAEVRSFNV